MKPCKPNESSPPCAPCECSHLAAGFARSAEVRTKRIQQSDMISAAEAAALAGVSRTTINAWIKSGRCLAVEGFKRGYWLPKWQFAIEVFDLIPDLMAALEQPDGWELLHFLEGHSQALGSSPLQAIITGSASKASILGVAVFHSHEGHS